MEALLTLAARVTGTIGVLLVVVSGIARLAGNFWLAGFQLNTLLLAGVGLLAIGCFCYLALLVERPGE